MRHLLIGIIFLAGSILNASEYYIDSESGKDENSGTTPQAAWNSLTKVNETQFQPGDSIYFKRGGLWRGTFKPKSGDSSQTILYSSYGEGEKPKFYCSVSLNQSKDWIQMADQLWATPVSDDSELTSTQNRLTTDVGNIILDGKKAAFKRWDKESLQNQDDFWFDLEKSQLWFRSEKNPAELYSEIEAALRRHVIDISGCHNAIFDNLDIRYGAAHGFGGSSNHHLIIRNCDISWIGGGDQYLQGGKGRRVRFGNGIEFWENANDHLIENNRLWEIYDAALTNQGSQNNRQVNIIYRNNEIWNCEYSFEFWNRGQESMTKDIVFENNQCFDAGFGWGHIQRPDKNGRHIMFYNNSSQTSGMIIQNNVFCNATESLVRLENDWTSGLTLNHNLYWQDNEQLPYFLWLKKNYGKQDIDSFRTETKMELDSKIQKMNRQ
ncbi:MAG: right-handed parallel beta-helix repeat-containing protein [Planctomycetia bacterium]|nr:right-handed parallel beta-helix repeat-containing protein [Planctomycetia bacterium]